jgi:hypothetical protein
MTQTHPFHQPKPLIKIEKEQNGGYIEDEYIRKKQKALVKEFTISSPGAPARLRP